MGLYYKGIPQQQALDLADQYGLTTFTETGTHIGNTALWASDWFDYVHTIESEKYYYNIAIKKLEGKGVNLLYGRSQQVLPELVKELYQPTLFWLDAHWGSDLQGDKPGIVCPVLAEITTVKQCGQFHVIMIDDHRLFNGKNGWPDWESILKQLSYNYHVWVDKDVIYAVPMLRVTR